MSGAPLRVPFALAAPGLAEMPSEAATYVTRVHRLGPGDRFVAFDPDRAVEADAVLVEVSKRSTVARIEALRPAPLRSTRRVVLIQGACKGDKMDAIVRDATELGATRIVPAITARSVAKPERARSDRWRRIAVEAARQCGRGDAPAIEAPASLSDVLAIGVGSAIAIAMDPTAELDLGERIAGVAAADEVTILVGPEGGLEAEELAAAERAGFLRVRLGGLVLRTETVCAAVLGALLVWTGSADFGKNRSHCR